MIVEPKIKGFICTTAHPKGCQESVRQQINYVKLQPRFHGPKRVLIIGASTGYGLASRIALSFGSGSKTLGIFFERPASGKRTASAGWYNTAAFERYAHAEGYYAKSINGDAFSDEVKAQAIDMIQKDFGQVDLVIYSLASPRRTDPKTGETYTSTLKPVGSTYKSTTIDTHTGELKPVELAPATEEEIAHTVAVMGGDDWRVWIETLKKKNLLAIGAQTLAYSYIGPEVTYPIYRKGTIGHAKDHLLATANDLEKQLQGIHGHAFIAVNKALVTQASSAIPVVPLYISLLFKVMKQKGIHEGCIEQMHRLYADRLYEFDLDLDEKRRIRVDDWEMRSDIQAEIKKTWPTITQKNVMQLIDLEGYREDFQKLFGFGFKEVNYQEDVEVDVPIPSLADH